MIADKYEAVLAWANTWPALGGYLKFNAILTAEGDASLNGIPNELVRESYIDGTALRRLTAQMKLIVPWSDGHDPVNVEQGERVASWLDWVSTQYDAGNVPAWDGAQIVGIEPSQNAPSIAAVYQDDGLAEYAFEAVIEYVE